MGLPGSACKGLGLGKTLDSVFFSPSCLRKDVVCVESGPDDFSFLASVVGTDVFEVVLDVGVVVELGVVVVVVVVGLGPMELEDPAPEPPDPDEEE